jgi:hypothetical protein
MSGDISGNTPGPWPANLDALAAAPDQHTVLLENDAVRVLDTRLRAGDRTPVHTHQWPSVLYVLSWSDFVRCDATGDVLIDSRTFSVKPVDGATLWSDALPPHSAQNVGSRELRVIAVELKRAINTQYLRQTFFDGRGTPLIGTFHNGAQPIDPFVFRDDDGQHYLYYGGWKHCNVTRLTPDLLKLAPFPDGEAFRDITPANYVEGPLVFKRLASTT